MTDLDDPRFTVAQSADAIGLSRATARDWFKDRIIWPDTLKGDVDAPAGGTRRLTFRRVYQLAIMTDLVRSFGLPAKRAAALAFSFSDIWTAPPDPDCGGFERPAGKLYENAFTLLRAHPGVDVGRIVRSDPNLSDVSSLQTARLLETRPWGISPDLPVMTLPLDAIIARVHAALAVDQG